MSAGTIRVEVVYAGSAGQQRVVVLELPVGASVETALRASGIVRDFPELDAANLKLGIYGERVTASTRLQDHDRVEIYRPLRADPKEVRRQRAKSGKAKPRGGAGKRGL
jgi:putative ubiquitin-RnfH superfamily antitoxin RatB of RatAB toxin-antitoxin module